MFDGLFPEFAVLGDEVSSISILGTGRSGRRERLQVQRAGDEDAHVRERPVQEEERELREAPEPREVGLRGEDEEPARVAQRRERPAGPVLAPRGELVDPAGSLRRKRRGLRDLGKKNDAGPTIPNV